MAYIASSIIDKIASLIDFRCGKCGGRSGVMFTPRSGISGKKGLLFTCHGDSEFLELSDAMISSPRRLKGYKPFSGDNLPLTPQWPPRPLPSFEEFRPNCSICDKPVICLIYQNESTTRDTMFVFNCHGQIEEFLITEVDMLEPDFKEKLMKYRPFSGAAEALVAAASDSANSFREQLRIKGNFPDEPDLITPESQEDLLIPAVQPRVITFED